MKWLLSIQVVFLLALGNVTTRAQDLSLETAQLLQDVRILAADSLEGRRTGTSGSIKAQRYILKRIKESGAQPPGGSFLKPFLYFASDSAAVDGANIAGWIKGSGSVAGSIVLTAHYDHLGKAGGLVVFNGADDNASGVSAVLSLATTFSTSPLIHNLFVVLLDGEEVGFRGANALIASGMLDTLNPVLNVNLDMISRNESHELFTGGAYHYPEFRQPLEAVEAANPVTLRFGHDEPNIPGVDDWSGMSDHAVFHAAGIPFIYFGVEDHADYHRPTDDFENIDPEFFSAAVETIRRAIVSLDEALAHGE